VTDVEGSLMMKLNVKLLNVVVVSVFMMFLFAPAQASQKVCFLTLTGGGFTGYPLPYKNCAACQSVKRNILKLAQKRGQPAKGTCRAGVLP
jgi:hypothetical protein